MSDKNLVMAEQNLLCSDKFVERNIISSSTLALELIHVHVDNHMQYNVVGVV